MSKVLAQLPDAEAKIVALLTPALAGRAQDVTVGVALPATWTTSTKPHVLVALDGTTSVEYPITAAASVRVTVFASTNTSAKALAALCEGLLLSYVGGSGIASIQSLSGVQPSKDTATGAYMASIAVRVNLRYTVLA